MGAARQVFLSAEETSSVVGHTADILLEIDESQDVSKDKYTKEFRPMASSTNATTVHYGTTWDDSTLLEEIKQSNRELEKTGRRYTAFPLDWQEVSKYNPDYMSFVESERARLGEDHPLFLSQYALLPIRTGGGFFSRSQIGQLQGEHVRLRARASKERIYVAGIDLAGEAEITEELELTVRGRDATVITVADVSFPSDGGAVKEPTIRIVEHYRWVGQKHPDLYCRMIDLLRNTWGCSRIVVDATGIGEAVASFLVKALGSRVVPFKFSQVSKSSLGFNLLAAINSGRLKLYRADGSDEYKELMFELERARSVYRPNQTINFFVDPSEGHDDYLMSLALCIHAAKDSHPRVATGRNRSE